MCTRFLSPDAGRASSKSAAAATASSRRARCAQLRCAAAIAPLSARGQRRGASGELKYVVQHFASRPGTHAFAAAGPRAQLQLMGRRMRPGRKYKVVYPPQCNTGRYINRMSLVRFRKDQRLASPKLNLLGSCPAASNTKSYLVAPAHPAVGISECLSYRIRPLLHHTDSPDRGTVLGSSAPPRHGVREPPARPGAVQRRAARPHIARERQHRHAEARGGGTAARGRCGARATAHRLLPRPDRSPAEPPARPPPQWTPAARTWRTLSAAWAISRATRRSWSASRQRRSPWRWVRMHTHAVDCLLPSRPHAGAAAGCRAARAPSCRSDDIASMQLSAQNTLSNTSSCCGPLCH